MDELVLLAAYNGYFLIRWDPFNETFGVEVSGVDNHATAAVIIPKDRVHELVDFIQQHMKE